MIGVLFSDRAAQAGRLVTAALRRSAGGGQVRPISFGTLGSRAYAVMVAVDVPDEWAAALLEWTRVTGRKLVVFGRMPAALAAWSACRTLEWPDALREAARSDAAPSREMAASRAVVRYAARAAVLGGREWERAFERFDFTDEWNNLGFGALRADESIWAVAAPQEAPEAARLASVDIDGNSLFSYAALWDTNEASLLWFNRAVGPIDSFEWRLVENFISGYRAEDRHCQPVLSEIPWGYDAAITSRLDCDEDIESARPLWDAYCALDVPFSLAVHTTNLRDDAQHAILKELAVDRHGAILSHTATHAPNWGGSYAAARAEGLESAALIAAVIGRPVRYAVSPFHQTPDYALAGLADAGYAGCIGGIIRNDPAFLLARGGLLADMPDGFVGHSQQCMLHGDCMLSQGDPLAVFKQAFDLALETRTLFGYLDHPFSSRYQYGWDNEAGRIDAHVQLIAYIRARAKRPLFVNEEVAMEFLQTKSRCDVIDERGAFRILGAPAAGASLELAVEWRGEVHRVADDGRLQ